MKLRKLGRTGLEVSEIGFGAWGLGGGMWKGGSDEEGRRAVRAAIDRGVTFLDTALVYGEGHSETIIGGVLAEGSCRSRVVLASKIPPMDYGWPGRAESPLREVFPPSHVVTCVEKSLRNLGVEHLDLMQLHVWHDAWLRDPLWGETRHAMESLRGQGKVGHWGVSVNSHAPESALVVLDEPLFEAVQVIYNIFDRSPERDLFDRVRAQRAGVIARVPFDEGTLTGSIGPETMFPAGDWRESYFAGERKEEALRRVTALRELLGEEASTLPELALRFCLQRPEVSTVIPGMRRVSHVEANASVSDGRRLSHRMIESLGEHAWEKNWYRD